MNSAILSSLHNNLFRQARQLLEMPLNCLFEVEKWWNILAIANEE